MVTPDLGCELAGRKSVNIPYSYQHPSNTIDNRQ